MLFRSNKGETRNDIARLYKKRFVTSIESNERRCLDEAVLKMVTGGDKITARFLYKEHFEFYPEFKLWLATNHKPKVKGDDHGIWRRIKLVPFTVQIPESDQDKNLSQKLRAELPGILNWLLEGLQQWQTHGLGAPDAVRRATAAYKEAEDVLSSFLSEFTLREKESRVRLVDLYTLFTKWANENGEEEMSNRELSKKLEERGFTKGKDMVGAYHKGIALTAKAQEAAKHQYDGMTE